MKLWITYMKDKYMQKWACLQIVMVTGISHLKIQYQKKITSLQKYIREKSLTPKNA